MSAFFADPQASPHISVWFRLFERFPERDAYGLFWSIVHRLEARPEYESELVASLRRRPTRITVSMVNRALNAGRLSIEGKSLLPLLEAFAVDAACLPSIREQAEHFVSYQRSRA